MRNTFSRFCIIVAAIPFFLLLSSCEKDPASPPVNNEHPPATTAKIYLVRMDGALLTTDTTTSLIRDTTVVKGKPAVEGTLSVLAGSNYKGFIKLIDESKTPAEDVTSDIEQEKDGHLFLYAPTNGIDTTRLRVHDLDKDGKGFDVGLTFLMTVSAGSPLNGILFVFLRHYDSNNKNDSVFDTDLSVHFPVEIR